MKAAYIEQPGPPADIRFGELPLPALADHAVLVRVEAVAVNHVDTYIRSGAYPVDLPSPFVIGRDMVGKVAVLGAKVRGFAVGDGVWSNCLGIEGHQGPFAEYVAAPEDRLYRLPDGLAPQQAVAVLHSALTAVIGLFQKAALAAGDSVFINGGSGSVGLAVLQIAKACGARVGMTAGSDEKARWCRQMGADLVVDYRRESAADAIRRFAPEGIDVFWQATAALDFEQAVPLMARHGRIVLIAGGERPAVIPARLFYQRNCSLHGFTVTGTPVGELAACARQINAWMSRGVLQPKIHQVLPLSRAREAHELQEAGSLSGKIVLVPDA